VRIKDAKNKKARQCLDTPSSSTDGTSGFFKAGKEMSYYTKYKNLSMPFNFLLINMLKCSGFRKYDSLKNILHLKRYIN